MEIPKINKYIERSTVTHKLLIVDNFKNKDVVDFLKNRFSRVKRNGNIYELGNSVIYVYGELDEIHLKALCPVTKYLIANINIGNLMKYKSLIIENKDVKYILTIRNV